MVENRFNLILHNDLYKKSLRKIEAYEKDRIFCRHNIQHFFDVGRIAYIMNLEKELGIKKDIIYAVALLHDIGRWKQYEEGIPHEKASADLAGEILLECGYDVAEIETILGAILSHRKESRGEECLEAVMYKADKLSRSCFSCAAADKCNWSEEMKNLNMRY
jgi:uncharacterized protein